MVREYQRITSSRVGVGRRHGRPSADRLEAMLSLAAGVALTSRAAGADRSPCSSRAIKSTISRSGVTWASLEQTLDLLALRQGGRARNRSSRTRCFAALSPFALVVRDR
jgi:hypothetical protein